MRCYAVRFERRSSTFNIRASASAAVAHGKGVEFEHPIFPQGLRHLNVLPTSLPTSWGSVGRAAFEVTIGSATLRP